MLAYTGRKADAVTFGERAVAAEKSGQGNQSYNMLLLVRTYLALGEPEKALDTIEELLGRPGYITPAWLRIDPTFDALRGNPRFERMVTSG
jgi:hypothetical protein